MRSCNINTKAGTMEPESEKLGLEPFSKRPKLDIPRQNVVSSSKLSNDSLDTGGTDSGSSSGMLQSQDVDHRSDDSVDDIDNLSELSNLSGLDDHFDETSWQPVAGPISWVQRKMSMGVDPRDILRSFIGEDHDIPEEWDQIKLWNIIISMMIEPQPRDKLPDVNTLDDVVALLKKCHNIMVLTGAGVSVSCGIPDFRSRNGIYARLAEDFPNLPDPQAMFDIDFFKVDQRPFFKFAKEIYPGQFKPSPCHRFIKHLETQGKLLRNYTQNIDTLEKVAGIERAIECHGSFATATCMVCKYNVDAEAIRRDIFDQQIPRCPRCGPEVELAVMKPDIVFFGESLPETFHKQMAADKDECDLLIVIGSSLKVRPVALIPNSLPAHVPQIVINREPLHRRLTFDVELLGNCDDIISELCKRLGVDWSHLAQPGPLAKEILYSELDPVSDISSDVQEVNVKRRKDVVEQNTDSGLGDLETLAAVEPGGDHMEQISHSGSHLVSGGDCHCTSNIDSSGESDTKPATKRHADLSAKSQSSGNLHAAAISDNIVSSSEEDVQGKDSSCFEASAQSDCTCSRIQQNPGESQCAHHETVSSTSPGLVNCRRDSLHRTSCVLHRSQLKRTTDACHNTAQFSASDGHCAYRRAARSHARSSESGDKIDLEKESHKDNTHCSHTDTIEEMRQMWAPRTRQSIASKIKDNQIIFIPPNRYVFHGAEVYSDDSDDSSDSEDSTPPLSPMQEDGSAEASDANEIVNSCLSPSSSPTVNIIDSHLADNLQGAKNSESKDTTG